ncbi:MAG TPA: hypothetical protein VFE47_25405 [Tepidisphaeraceae bacterium]|jgi:hypothetical protein|nr:hypothetical protein [Tepidisphaeraceae bacterium]
MTTANLQYLTRLSFAAEKLMADHPPKFRNRNKQLVFDIGCSANSIIGGTITYTRWGAMVPPAEPDALDRVIIEGREDVYDYIPFPGGSRALEWHVNFADPHLFCAYGSGLLAQDEMQVAEHPALGPLLEALYASGENPVTVEGCKPTPVLIRGAERRVRIATDANAEEGRPLGLYGNRFAAAGTAVIERAVTRIDPPTITNLIAMAAPAGGSGAYTWDQIDYILVTAFTGFRAAKHETLETRGKAAKTVIHTGFWGCGAFGGNRALMALLQLVAAHLAGIDCLGFHTHQPAGTEALARARGVFAQLIGGERRVQLSEMIDAVVAMRWQWGVGDGN